MVSQTFTITNSQGFHMRPAGTFTSAMGKYQSTVTIVKDGNRIDGKSIMNLIAACIKCGTEITVEIEGPDEEAAMKEAAEGSTITALAGVPSRNLIKSSVYSESVFCIPLSRPE